MEGKKKKIAFFIGSLNRGGTETLVLDTFCKKDYADFVPVLIYRNDGDLTDAYRDTGVPMFRIKPTCSKIGYIAKLRRLLKKERVDVLHTQTLLNAVLGIFCTCISRVKLVASFHGFFSSLKNRVFTHLVMWFADASVFVSGYVRDWYVNRILFVSKKRCHVVYNGIDFSKFDKKYDKPSFLKNNDSVKPGVVKMAMVGNFVSGRSQYFLCQALKELNDKRICDFRFYFVGKRSDAEPQLYDECVRYCKENDILDNKVFFLGGRGDVPAILQNIDIFVYSTNEDTFGIAVVEAIASGLPVIVNDWGVMREISNDGVYAFIYKTKVLDDCVKKIEIVVNCLSEYKKEAQVNASKVREQYSIDAHIKNLSYIYNVVKN